MSAAFERFEKAQALFRAQRLWDKMRRCRGRDWPALKRQFDRLVADYDLDPSAARRL